MSAAGWFTVPFVCICAHVDVRSVNPRLSRRAHSSSKMAKLCVLLLMASPLISALVATRAAPTTVVAPTLARSCDVAAAVRTQQRAAVVMMGRGGRQREDRPPKEKKEKDVLELEGTVLESLPNAMFRVQLQDSDAVSGLLMLQPRPARAPRRGLRLVLLRRALTLVRPPSQRHPRQEGAPSGVQGGLTISQY